MKQHIGILGRMFKVFMVTALLVLALSTVVMAGQPERLYYTITDLGTLGGTYSWGWGINNFGEVTGESTIAGDVITHAFLYSSWTGMKDIGALGDNANSSAGYGINDLGQVTGWSLIAGDVFYHAFLYTPRKGMEDIGPPGTYSYGNSINNLGQVTGAAQTPGGDHVHAFLYSAGQTTDLLTLLPPSSGWTILYEGWGINDLGQITGVGVINGQVHAFLMTPVY